MDEKLDKKPRRAGKSAEAWADAMSEEGGMLGPLSDKAFKLMEGLSAQDWEAAYEYAKRKTGDFKMYESAQSTILMDDDHSRRFPHLKSFRERLPVAWLAGTPDSLALSVPAQMQRILLGPGFMLRDQLYKALRHIDTEDAKLQNDALDLSTPAAILLDNVQTILDVETLLTRFAKTPEELVTLSERLLQVCPNDEVAIDGRTYKVNPRGYSYLELFALAPFGFWADRVRMSPPETYRDVPVVRPHDADHPIDPHFIYMITRERPNTMRDRESRHGGCPALQPAFREMDLIKRLGALYVQAQREFIRHES